MEVQVVQLSSAWGTAVACTIALRFQTRECVFCTVHLVFYLPHVLLRQLTIKTGLHDCTVFTKHSLLYGLVVAALIWKMGVLISSSPGTAVKRGPIKQDH